MNIVVLDAATLADTSLDELAQLGSLTCYNLTNQHELIERCQDADVVVTNKVVINQQAMAQLPQLIRAD